MGSSLHIATVLALYEVVAMRLHEEYGKSEVPGSHAKKQLNFLSKKTKAICSKRIKGICFKNHSWWVLGYRLLQKWL